MFAAPFSGSGSATAKVVPGLRASFSGTGTASANMTPAASYTDTFTTKDPGWANGRAMSFAVSGGLGQNAGGWPDPARPFVTRPGGGSAAQFVEVTFTTVSGINGVGVRLLERNTIEVPGGVFGFVNGSAWRIEYQASNTAGTQGMVTLASGTGTGTGTERERERSRAAGRSD
ncbi:hypothetical protein JOJ86_002933 [Rhodococcus percolatus]|uniref:hypothetical protein n=1 Tax=Rhodococcus opacus TaxID=37919 RepID=UPI0015FA49F9|nr:hypothetical protein [Rhodococcus opacus]MBA8959641.1 hypothetical protein [Rhodococcus opacus]MBP2205207.1 hypothetical protein [Rhodococcus opacus]